MPILAKSSGTVTGLWGSAYVRLPSGKLKSLTVGDQVKPGEQIVTTQNGIVQITPAKGKPIEIKPNVTKPVGPTSVAQDDLDKTIAAVERGDDDAATAAGLTGGANGGLLPGLRVDRVSESVNPLEYQYETARTGPGGEIERGEQLFFAAPVDVPQLTVSGPASVNEAAGTITYTIRLSSPSDAPVTVKFATQDATATAGQDYDATSGTLTFLPGQTVQTVTVKITNDSVFEGSEQLRLVLTEVTGGAQVATPTTTTTIRDDGQGDLPPGTPPGTPLDNDAPKVSAVSSPSADEGGSLSFKVDLSNTSNTPTVVTLKLSSGSATLGTDTGTPVKVSFDGTTFTNVTVNANGTINVTVPAGGTGLTLTVPTLTDNLIEGSENITLTGSTAANTTPVAGTGTIIDTTVLPVVSILQNVSAQEGGNATFTIKLDKPSDTEIRLMIRTVDGSASGDDDYAGIPGGFPVVIQPGATEVTVDVPVFRDDVAESPETFVLEIGSIESGNATIGTKSGTATIEDGSPTLAVEAVSNASTVEGSDLSFQVTLNQATTAETPIYLRLFDGTAIVGQDVPKAVKVSFDGGTTFINVPLDAEGTATVSAPAGSSGLLVRVPTIVDGFGETDQDGSPQEHLYLSVSTSPDEAPETGVGVILEPPVPVVSISNATAVAEGEQSEAMFKISLSVKSDTEVRLILRTKDISASGEDDYAGLDGYPVIIPPGVTEVMVPVLVFMDDLKEATETFTLEIVSAENATIGQGAAIGTILDTTPPLEVSSVSNASTFEGGNLDFQVTLSEATTANTPVYLRLFDGTATVGQDVPDVVKVSFDGGATFTDVALNNDGRALVTVPAGQSGLLVRVPTIQDNVAELDGNGVINPEVLYLDVSTSVDQAPVTAVGSITDLAKVSISDAALATEGGKAFFTVSLDHPTTSDVQIIVRSLDGSASGDEDFGGFSGLPIVIPAGQTSFTFEVALSEDDVLEPIEDFKVEIVSVSDNAVVVDPIGVGQILDSEGAPAVATVQGSSAPEGSDLEFVVTLTGKSSVDTPVTLKLTDGTGTVGTDTGTPVKVSFDGTNFTDVTVKPDGTIDVVVPAGSTGLTLKVPTSLDTISEGDETIKLTAGTPANTTPVEGTGTINDSNGLPKLSINDVEVNEAAGTATFTVTLTNPSSTPVTVNWATKDGSAVGGSNGSGDFDSANGQLTFAPGVTSQTVTVKINNDGQFEGIENYTVELTNASANAQILDGSGLGGINDQGGPTTPPPGPNTPPTTPDDDRPKVSNVSSPSTTEGGDLQFKVDLSNPSKTDTPVTLKLTDGTGTVGTDTGTPVQVSFDGTNFTPVTVNPDGTVNVTVPAGSTSLTLKVPTINDTFSEADETIKLSAATPANTTPVQGEGTIIDNDGTPKLSINDVEVNEAAGTATFTVTLSNPSATAVTVNWATKDGSAVGGSNGSGDFDSANGQLTFAPGVTSQTVTVKINNDNQFEGIENYTVELTNASANAQILDGSGLGGINDQGGPTTPPPGPNTPPTTPDDDTPKISISGPGVVNEASGTITYTVTLSNPSAKPVTVNYAGVDGTAQAGSDYTVQGSSLTFAANETTKTITVAINNDTQYEGSETFSVQLSNPTNATINTGTANTTIRDDGQGELPPGTPPGTPLDNDTPKVSSVSSPSANEGDGLTFRVDLSNPSKTDTPVTLKLTDGTGTVGTDTGTPVKVSFDGTTFTDVTVNPDGTINVIVPAGKTEIQLLVPTTEDAVSEGNETIKLSGSTPANTTPVVGTGTIVDDDGAPQLTVDGPVTVNEAAGTITYTIKLSNPSATDVTVKYATQDVSATAGQDYEANSGTLTFTPGQTSQTVTVKVTNDNVFEGSEDLKLVLSDATGGAQIATPSATTTIRDDGQGELPPGTPPGTPLDDDTPKISISGPGVVNEASGTITYTVTLSNPSAKPVTVNYAGVDGTAQAGSDYTVQGSSLTFAANETTKTITVAINNDTQYEGSETFSVQLSNPTNATINTGTANTTIRDDGQGELPPGTPPGTPLDNDTPKVSISGPGVVNEASGTITYTVTLSNPSTKPVTVNYAGVDGTAQAGSDYTVQGSGSLTFGPNETTKTITVAINNDTQYEGSETFSLQLSNPTGATIDIGTANTAIRDDGQGTLPPGTPPGTPLDNDTPKVSNVSSPSTTEGGDLQFKVDLSNPSKTDTPVTLKLTDGTGTVGTDTGTPVQVSFDGTNFTTVTVNPDGTVNVTVPAGSTSLTLKVPTINDTFSEVDETIKLSAATPANTTPVQGEGTIVDNDGTPKLSINDVEVNEAAGTATFTVTLSNPSATAVTVNWATKDGTAVGGSNGSGDFDSANGQLTFAPGVTSQTVTVKINNDNQFEGIENYTVELTGASANAQILDGSGLGGINDQGGPTTPPPGPNTPPTTPDDDTPKISISGPGVVNEASGTITYTVTLSNPSAKPVTVNYAGVDGTAQAGSDYTVQGNSLTFAANETTKTITVAINNDTQYEGSETFSVQLSNPTNATINTGTANTTIRDDGQGELPPGTPPGTPLDNDTPKVSISGPGVVNEASGTITYTVTLSNPSTKPVTVNYAGVDGTAQAGSDYTVQGSGSLTFGPNETTKTITVAINNDTQYEGSETFSLQLSNPTGATIDIGTANTAIRDDGQGTLPPGTPPGKPLDNDTPKVSNVSSPSTTEGGDLQFKVDLSNPSKTDTPVTLKLTDGTGTVGTDTGTPVQVSFDGTNFTTVTVNPDGTVNVTVPAGSTSLTLKVPTINDTFSEVDETIKLSAATPANTTPVQGEGTIVDNDGTPKLSINDVEVNEAAGTATFTVTLSNPSATAVTVNWATKDGTAVGGSNGSGDFDSANGQLTFAPGVTSQTVTVKINNDGQFEGIENYTVELTGVSANAQILDGSGLGGINDQGGPTTPLPGPNTPPTTPDDDRPTIAVQNTTVVEGGQAVFAVTLTKPSSAAQTVSLTLNQGSATAGSDYTNAMEVSFNNGNTWQTVSGGQVSVPAGATAFQVRVSTINDTVTEASETFSLNASMAVSTNGSATGTATITDNDAPPALDLDANNSSGITGTGYTATYTENGVGIRVVDTDVTITDADSTQLVGASVKLNNAQAGDVLAVGSLPAGIQATVSNGVVTLSGTASLADYQTALGAITFASTSDAPSTVVRSIDVTVNDGTSTSNVANTTINVVAVNDAPTVTAALGNVSEEGLANGLPDTTGTTDTTNLTKVSGTIAVSDPDSGSFTFSLTAPTTAVQTASGQTVAWTSDGNGGLIGKAGALVVATATITNGGSYTFELLAPLKHAAQGEDTLDINFGVKVSDGTATTNSTLTIRVEDDAPATPPVVTDTVSVLDTNVMIMLDISGSMNDASGIGSLTRLQAAVQSINTLLDKYDQIGGVAVRLVTFSGTAQALGGDQWVTVATAKTLLQNVTATGGTNYDYALTAGQTAFASSTGKITGAQNVSYFFSDGNPTLSSANPNANTNNGSTTDANLGDGIDVTEEAAWTSFLNTNGINSYAVGLGTGVAQTYLDPVAYDGRFLINKAGTVVTDLNQLDSVLSNTVRESSSGQLISDGAVGTPLGADGGYIKSIVIDGTTYNYNAANPEINVVTALGGNLKLNMGTGVYTYLAPDKLTASSTETFNYVLTDLDGDVASGSLVLNVDRNAPVPGAPTVSAAAIAVSEEGLAGGLADTTGVSDTTNATAASGQLSFATTGGATVSSVVATAPTTTVFTTSGQAVVWVSDNNGGLIGKAGSADGATVASLTMSRSGAYTYTQTAAIKHAGAGEDVLDINFGARVLDSSNRVGQGSFTVRVEDDAPPAVTAPLSASVTALNTNLLITLDVSGSMNDVVSAGKTRLQLALEGVQKLLDRYDAVGDVAVRLVTFSDVTKTPGGDTWLTVAQAKTLLSNGSITASGGTNYDYALSASQTAFATTAGKLGNAQNVSYFLSDGNPTLSSTNPTSSANGGNNDGSATNTNLGDGIDATEEANWITFLNNNQIKTYAVGLGSDVSATYLNPVAYDGHASSNTNGTVVTDVTTLDAALAGTVAQAVTGVLVGAGGFTAFGADGYDHINTVTTTGGTKAYDAANPLVTVTTDQGGTLTINMTTSEFTYSAPGGSAAGVTDTINLVLSDKDGDVTSSSISFVVEQAQVRIGTATGESITGSNGPDRILGRDGADTINGGSGNDVIFGNGGNDSINGGDGNDTITGGAGSDNLTGGLGSDVFAWHLSDAGANSANRAVDTIKDFNVAAPSAGGDVLDLRDLLSNETTANLSNYLDFSTSAAQTVIRISPTGAFSNGNYSATSDTQQIVLEGVNLRDVNVFGLGAAATDKDIIDKLLQQGKLLIGNS